ncbi:MAG: acyl carrier protein [Candidatus Omnitrophica bacterium]|nr:acyl carrier protein [Candidatus Omnitrophota bacterium]
MPQNLEQEVKELIAGVIGREPEELKLETNFWKDLGVDSIKAIEITVAIERKFKVSVRDEEIPKITTVGQAVAVIKGALEKKAK